MESHLSKKTPELETSSELSELGNDYNDNSLKTLIFYATLEKCLNQAKNSQLHILTTLEQFEEEKVTGSNHYVRTLHELKNFKAVGDPFSEEFFKIYNSVYNQHILMLENLQFRKTEFDTKLKSIRTWTKFLGVIFAATINDLLICSIVAVVTIDSKRVVAAIDAASAVPIGSMDKWIDTLFKNYEDELKAHKEVIISMQVGTQDVDIKSLNNI
ncbi:unnamed protein product [Lupinus luteus]|uniref:Uncharacterized protein n=1 Tax=Lupinus luteus TaxID=3873 RepID=A0AAV1WVC3_LUPLU